MNEIATAMVAKMQADTDPGGLSASDGVLGGFHRGKAPEGTIYPRIVFKSLIGLPQYVTVGEAFRKTFVQFNIYATDPVNGGEAGVETASRLNKRVQAIFTDPDLALAGLELIHCRIERELPSNTETDAATGSDVFSEGCVIEVWTG